MGAHDESCLMIRAAVRHPMDHKDTFQRHGVGDMQERKRGKYAGKKKDFWESHIGLPNFPIGWHEHALLIVMILHVSAKRRLCQLTKVAYTVRLSVN